MSQPHKRFLYKIWSGYDGFSPRRIPERRDQRKRLVLGWDRYIDVIEVGAEVWVYFYGPHAFKPGVYVKGFVNEIQPKAHRVYLNVREVSSTAPLTDETVNDQVAEAVSQRGRQVFFLPEAILPAVPECGLDSCKARQCDRCSRWHSIPRIRLGDLRTPGRLPDALKSFVAAYWVVPSRCFLWYDRQIVAGPVSAGSDMFYQFKAGEGRLAFPLSRGIYDVLCDTGLLVADAVVPVPLSPDKLAAGELNRPLVLARELGSLLGISVTQVLSLREAISKRQLRNAGVSVGEFERRYLALLNVEPRITQLSRILLIDDVCDHGSTLRCTALKLREMAPDLEIVAATAGQMIVKEAVRERTRLVA